MADATFRFSLFAAAALAAALAAPPAAWIGVDTAWAQTPIQAPARIPMVAPAPSPIPAAAPTPGQIRAGEELDKLEPSRSSVVARETARAMSSVERVALYESQMRAALVVETPPARSAGIASARRELAQAANKELTPSAIERIDALRGLPPVPSSIGAGG